MGKIIDRLLDKERILVAGHRGVGAFYPENTLLSIQKALEMNVDMIEFDMNLTKDKVVVIMHDRTVDRTTNGKGYIHDMTLKQIKELDAGGKFGKAFEGLKVPTLREFCELVQPYENILLNAEIKEKTYETVDLAMEVLKEYGLMHRCVFTCFDAFIAAYMYDSYGVRVQGFPKEKMENFIDGENGTYSKLFAVGIDMKIITPQRVQEFENLGILPWSYCPDTDELVYESVRCGARLMTCNNPLPALKILKEKGRHSQMLKGNR